MNIDQFVTETNGQHVDEDGYYGAQCWDLVAKYARVVVGCPSFPTGSGGAEGLYRIFADPIPQYFTRVSGGYKKGDVIVWQASFSPPYGHTALCLDFDGTTLTVLEQNGNNPGGVSYIKQRSLVGVSGALRPKGNSMNKDQAAKLALYIRLLAFESVDEANSHSADDVAHILADPGYAGAIAEAVYAGEWQVPAYKAGHYDELSGQFEEFKKSDALKDQRIADLQKQVPNSTEVEQPVVSPVPSGKSLWQVIGDFFSQFKKG